MPELATLAKRLGYQFRDSDLFERALHHRSAQGKDNERLEFLGDSILNMTIAEYLFDKFPSAKEGQLSRIRANVVCGETLAQVGADLGLGDYVLLGPGELKSGGHRRRSIVGDCVEALIAAIYLDSDLATVKPFILKWFSQTLASVSLDNVYKDAKTLLQEWGQSQQLPLPVYTVVSTEGPAHNQVFLVTCTIEGMALKTQGRGSSRRKAEQEAAKVFYEKVSHESAS